MMSLLAAALQCCNCQGRTFKGKGLPCEAPASVRLSRTRVWFALALALATWGTSVALGGASLATHFEDAP